LCLYRAFTPSKKWSAVELSHFGTRHSLMVKLPSKYPARPEATGHQGTVLPQAHPPDFVMSVQAKSRTSNLTAFVVNETVMTVADKDGRTPTDPTAYRAYCSDGMSDRGFPFSIHLIVDGKAHTGCCSTATRPPMPDSPLIPY
jgi:hypothetical protein